MITIRVDLFAIIIIIIIIIIIGHYRRDVSMIGAQLGLERCCDGGSLGRIVGVVVGVGVGFGRGNLRIHVAKARFELCDELQSTTNIITYIRAL